MSAKKAKKRKENVDLDSLAEWLMVKAQKRLKEDRSTDQLKKGILRDAETVARWKKKPFYVA